jgi:hypothetical protein
MSSPRVGRFGNALGLLVAEFLVIVLGVLVALAVDQYTSAREERARIATHLEQLSTELGDMAEKLAVERQRYESSLLAATKVIEGLTTRASVPSDSLVIWFPKVFISRDWEPETTVINTMISSGDMGLVHDRALESEMTRFRERVQAVAYRRALAEELFMDGYRALIQSADMLRWAPGAFGTSPTEQEWDWDDLTDDLMFRNGVYGMANGVRNHRRALNRLATDIETLQDALARSGRNE